MNYNFNKKKMFFTSLQGNLSLIKITTIGNNMWTLTKIIS